MGVQTNNSKLWDWLIVPALWAYSSLLCLLGGVFLDAGSIVMCGALWLSMLILLCAISGNVWFTSMKVPDRVVIIAFGWPLVVATLLGLAQYNHTYAQRKDGLIKPVAYLWPRLTDQQYVSERHALLSKGRSGKVEVAYLKAPDPSEPTPLDKLFRSWATDRQAKARVEQQRDDAKAFEAAIEAEKFNAARAKVLAEGEPKSNDSAQGPGSAKPNDSAFLD